MGQIRATDSVGVRERPLASSETIGRHWGCGVRLRDPRVPLHWLELRWRQPVWAWRCLAVPEITTGSGRDIGSGWRALSRVSLHGDVSIELIDDAAPALFVEDLETGDVIDGLVARDSFVAHEGGVRQVLVGSGHSRTLHDGDVFVSASGRPRRLHLPVGVVETLRSLVDVEQPECTLHIDVRQLRATFTQDAGEVTISGECVRVLAVYALERIQHVEGYLDTAEAHTRWIGLGGLSTSRAERIGWERGKIRERASRAGLRGVRNLFEQDRPGPGSRTRLGLNSSDISVFA